MFLCSLKEIQPGAFPFQRHLQSSMCLRLHHQQGPPESCPCSAAASEPAWEILAEQTPWALPPTKAVVTRSSSLLLAVTEQRRAGLGVFPCHRSRQASPEAGRSLAQPGPPAARAAHQGIGLGISSWSPSSDSELKLSLTFVSPFSDFRNIKTRLHTKILPSAASSATPVTVYAPEA